MLEESEYGESWTVTQLMTFFLCLETVLERDRADQNREVRRPRFRPAAGRAPLRAGQGTEQSGEGRDGTHAGRQGTQVSPVT